MIADQHVMALYTEFTRLRQTGYSRDEAWLELEPQVNELTQRELGRLLALLRAWEAQEGKNFKPSRGDDPHATRHQRPAGLEELHQEMDASKKRNVIRRIKPPDASTNGESGLVCPSCYRVNPHGEAYCYGCGTLLVPAGGTQRIQPQAVDDNEDPNAYFGDGMVLYLQVPGDKRTMRIQPRHSEMVIGRKSADSVMIPDIDLAAYNAETFGVSRLHAGLKRHENTLILTDMGSLNHTYINGQRLHAHEVRVLHDGDEIRFGSLALRVYFRQE